MIRGYLGLGLRLFASLALLRSWALAAMRSSA